MKVGDLVLVDDHQVGTLVGLFAGTLGSIGAIIAIVDIPGRGLCYRRSYEIKTVVDEDYEVECVV